MAQVTQGQLLGRTSTPFRPFVTLNPVGEAAKAESMRAANWNPLGSVGINSYG